MPDYVDFVANEKKEEEKEADKWFLEQLSIDNSELDVDVKMIYVVAGGDKGAPKDSAFTLAAIVVIAIVALGLVIWIFYKLFWAKCRRTTNVQKHIEHSGALKSMNVVTKA